MADGWARCLWEKLPSSCTAEMNAFAFEGFWPIGSAQGARRCLRENPGSAQAILAGEQYQFITSSPVHTACQGLEHGQKE